MVVIRLARTGAKKTPFYHVVATDRRNSRDGRYIERLGYFNPMARGQEKVLELELARVDYWLDQGAQPSDRVNNLLKKFRNGKVPSAQQSQSEIRKSQAEKAAVAARKKLEEELKAAEATAKAEAAAKAAEEKAAKEAAAAEAAVSESNADKAKDAEVKAAQAEKAPAEGKESNADQ